MCLYNPVYILPIKIKLIIILLTCILVYFAIPPSPLLENISFSQRVLDRNGVLMRISLSKDDKYRIFTPFSQIPSNFIEAVILYEDQYYYSHFGINPISLLKAFYSTYLTHGRKLGGSTITMQLARLKFGINSSNLRGKIYQIIKALHLELHYSKNEILEAYLNLVPYGGNIEGAGASSYIYFERNLQELNLLNILSLAVIPQNPIKRGVGKNSKEDAARNDMQKARKDLFSKWLRKHPKDIIYERLLDLPIKPTTNLPFIAPHFTLDILAQNNNLNTVHVTIDKNLQTMLEKQIELYIRTRKQKGINNATAMLIDFTTMEVLASIGSGNFFNNKICGQINGVKSYRSPGSTLKPFVYALAFDQSLIHPLTLLKDIPTYYDSYKPENFDSRFDGALSARESLIRSRNIPVVFLASKLKKPNFYEFLQQAQITKSQLSTNFDTYGLSIALGSLDVNMEELVMLYSMLANLGAYQPLKKLTTDLNTSNAKNLISPEASYLTLDILKDTTRPHAYQNLPYNLPVYWKTGTSNSFKDAWTVGVFGKYVLAVWIGDFNGRTHGSFTGFETAAPLFFNIIEAMEGKIDQDLITDKASELNITRLKVCADTGDIDNGMCPIKAETLFIKGKSPIKQSGIYRKALINTKSGIPACNFMEGQTEYQILNLWPADLLSVYKKAGINILPKPMSVNHCNKLINSPYQKPKITYPLQNSVYSIKNSAKISLTATSDQRGGNVFWFVNNKFIAKTKPNEPILWEPRLGQEKSGKFIIRVIDGSGESDAVKVFIQF